MYKAICYVLHIIMGVSGPSLLIESTDTNISFKKISLYLIFIELTTLAIYICIDKWIIRVLIFVVRTNNENFVNL